MPRQREHKVTMNAPRTLLHHGAIGQIHVFCDESGGTDPANNAFLAAAVAIVPADAQKLIKSFRKAAKVANEVKGHRLTREQRQIFFELLGRRAEVVSVVVKCSRGHVKGDWAMKTLPEVHLYSQLLAEACMGLPNLASAGHLTITPDGGRYKKARLDLVREQIMHTVCAYHPVPRVNVNFGDSRHLPGLQVADVIANSVFQSLAATEAGEASRMLLHTLLDQGRLQIHDVELEKNSPKWLVDI